MKKIILLITILLFSNTVFAHSEHYDTFLKDIKGHISMESFDKLKNNIKTFNYEMHFTNYDQKLEKELEKIFLSKNFDSKAYVKKMEEIFKKMKINNVNTQKSADILKTFNQKDRKVFYDTMIKLKNS